MLGAAVPIAIAPTNATVPRIVGRFLVMVHLPAVGGFRSVLPHAAGCLRVNACGLPQVRRRAGTRVKMS
jgi:hypothetical protein